MPARTVLFGATGYTGRLVAEAMVERGMRPVLAARGRDALEALAADLGGLETAVADVSDPASVRALVERGDVLVTTVGPFARWGEPRPPWRPRSAGAHYIDSTGEPAFIRAVFERYGPAAERVGQRDADGLRLRLGARQPRRRPGARTRRRRRRAGRHRLLHHRQGGR